MRQGSEINMLNLSQRSKGKTREEQTIGARQRIRIAVAKVEEVGAAR